MGFSPLYVGSAQRKVYAHQQGEDDNLAAMAALHAGVAVRLEAREGRERDLPLPRVLSPRPPAAFPLDQQTILTEVGRQRGEFSERRELIHILANGRRQRAC
jgi:hypothetical protein